jgi:hypothetical protein
VKKYELIDQKNSVQRNLHLGHREAKEKKKKILFPPEID